ncbi:MAG TPA: helix-turn-helix transcriptional regulator [Anaerolineae bacterium]|nr:helix-turn-helix transcriptional regulator [Anaerolineae bacterium]HQJ50315.1 helix-turn-helix transcriptional regulator [Anaerolineae bacterium]
MDHPDSSAVRQKIMGVLLRHVRQAAARSQAELAASLHITAARYAQYEHGQREITLPELEVIAELCDVPLGFFFDHEASVDDERANAPDPAIPRLQRKLIGLQLRQARQCAGKSLKELAEALGVPSRHISDYENGEREIPSELRPTLAALLNMAPVQLESVDQTQG